MCHYTVKLMPRLGTDHVIHCVVWASCDHDARQKAKSLARFHNAWVLSVEED